MNTIEDTFAANLKRRRLELNLTQKQLADRIDYSEKSISKWEQAQALPPSNILPPLAQALQTDINCLFRSGEAARYFLGIDGGGTKTEFLLVDHEGNSLCRTLLGACNPVDIGMNGTKTVLAEGIEQTCRNVPYEQISVFAGIAGGITGDYAEQIRHFLQRYPFAAIGNASDAESAVKAGLLHRDGVIVILGTGAIAFSQIDGVSTRYGGFGYLFEDNGSGYAFGQQAILAALNAETGLGPDTCLLPLLCKRLDSEQILPRLGEFYSGGKRKIASYAPVFFEALAAGDAVAASIFDAQMAKVANLITVTASALKTPVKEIKLLGSIAQKEPCVTADLQRRLGKNYNISACDRPVIYGALILAGMKGTEQ